MRAYRVFTTTAPASNITSTHKTAATWARLALTSASCGDIAGFSMHLYSKQVLEHIRRLPVRPCKGRQPPAPPPKVNVRRWRHASIIRLGGRARTDQRCIRKAVGYRVQFQTDILPLVVNFIPQATDKSYQRRNLVSVRATGACVRTMLVRTCAVQHDQTDRYVAQREEADGTPCTITYRPILDVCPI